jgi:flagellin-like hook-associated protein FlgL
MFIGMQSSFMPSTLAHNLNDSVSRMQKMHRHLQTGERLIESSDNPGDFAVKAKLNMRRANSELMGANIQNTVSFLQVQQGMLETVGTVLQRMAELKTQQDTIFATDDVNDMYNYEFKELQGQLSEISQSKFNGISLFSDQMPKVLFGESIGTDPLKPETHENQTDNEMNLTRWGMYRALSKSLTAGDKLHEDFGENPEALCMSIVNESIMGEWTTMGDDMDDWNRSYHHHGVEGGEEDQYVWEDDTNDWLDFLTSNNIKAKIGVIHTQGAEMAPDRPYPGGPYSNPMGTIDEGFTPAAIELSSRGNFPYLKMQKEGAEIPEQVAIFHEAFDSLTNGKTNLPDILVLNADNSGSMGFSEVNEALLQFKAEVEQIYTDKGKKVLISSYTSSNFTGEIATAGENIAKKENGYLEGIRINEGEDYIRQGQMALEDAIAEYNAVEGKPFVGTLDDSKSGVKGLMEALYDLEDFDSSDFVGFIEKLTEAMAVNGAETSRATSELEELNTRQLGLEKSMENIDGLDFSLAMTRYTAAQVETQFRAQLVSKAEDLHVRIADLLE